MSAKRCVRCGAETFGLVRSEADIHVCPDIAKRLARRERQVQAIMPIIEGAMKPIVAAEPRVYAEAIVIMLAGMGVTEDA